MLKNQKLLYTAQFDPKVSQYVYWAGVFILIITVVGIALIPFWLLFGIWYGKKFYESFSLKLYEKHVVIKRGVFTRSESHIPIDRITDIKIYDDIGMRWSSIRGLKIETAGQGGPSAGSEGNLIGVVDAENVRNMILGEFDKTQEIKTKAQSSASTQIEASNQEKILKDILATLKSMKKVQ